MKRLDLGLPSSGGDPGVLQPGPSVGSGSGDWKLEKMRLSFLLLNWGRHSTEVAFSLLIQPSWIRISALPKFYDISHLRGKAKKCWSFKANLLQGKHRLGMHESRGV